MNKLITALFSTLLITIFLVQNVSAQTNSFDLKKTSDQYKTSGTLSLTRSGNTMKYSIVVKDLPTQLPGNGVYYLTWALTPEGRASNLGPITNNSELTGTLGFKATQFFITSEKDRYPEFVQGPRIAQTDTIPSTTYDGLTTASPAPSGSARASASPSTPPIGGPTGAPETGLGGAALFNAMILSLGGIGVFGLFLSLRNKFRKS